MSVSRGGQKTAWPTAQAEASEILESDRCRLVVLPPLGRATVPLPGAPAMPAVRSEVALPGLVSWALILKSKVKVNGFFQL